VNQRSGIIGQQSGADMSGSGGSKVSECGPDAAWSDLSANKSSLLVDVRTRPEWSFVGVPDLQTADAGMMLSEWRQFPGMGINLDFATTLLADLGQEIPAKIFFICRSGARSLEAARAVAEVLNARGQSVECINVAEGFEGDIDQDGHRGRRNGWKARGLPWRQT
jgi:rhodanese-related sulfurtransferase